MKRIGLIVRKDLLVLWRSPVLLGTLIAYPLVIALLVGLVAGYANAKPRVALVDEAGLPSTITLAGETFDVDETIREVSENVKLVRLSRDEAARELRNGEVVATITIPSDFLGDLRGMLRSPKLGSRRAPERSAHASTSRFRRSSTRSTASFRGRSSARTWATWTR